MSAWKLFFTGLLITSVSCLLVGGMALLLLAAFAAFKLGTNAPDGTTILGIFGLGVALIVIGFIGKRFI